MTDSIVITIAGDHPAFSALRRSLDAPDSDRAGYVLIEQGMDGTWSCSFAYISPRGRSLRHKPYLVQIATVNSAISDASSTGQTILVSGA